jgi:hypothetical protein
MRRAINQIHPRQVCQAPPLAYPLTPTSSSWINQVERFFALPAEQQIKRAVSMDQTSRRHFRFVGTLLSSDDQPSRTDSIVLAILASPFKSKLRTGILVDVHPVSPRKTEDRKPQRPWFGPDGQPVKVTSRAQLA